MDSAPSLSDFAKTADTIYFSDTGRYNGASDAASWATFMTDPDGTQFSAGGIGASRSYVQCIGCPAGGPYGLGPCCRADTVVNRHLATTNVAFLDGHVKAMAVSKLTVPFFDAAARGGLADYWDKR